MVYRLLFFLLVLLFGHNQVFAQQDKEFWFAVPYVTPGHGNSPILVSLSSTDKMVNYKVEIPAVNTVLFTGNIQPFSTITIDLTPFLVQLQTTANTKLNNGLHIVSDNRMSVYYEVSSSSNSDIFVLKGKNALGVDFVIPAPTNTINAIYNPPALNSFDIVATHDNTTVTIIPKRNIVGHPAGVPFVIVLNKGQTYSAVAMGVNSTDHLGGSLISADKPVAVTIKDDSIYMPGWSVLCHDIAGDQLIPTSLAGTKYITMPGFLYDQYLGTSVPTDWVYITAVNNHTEVKVNGVIVDTLDKGEIYTLASNNNVFFIESSLPVLVYQITGSSCEVGGAILPPIGCTGSSNISFNKSPVGGDSLYLFLLVESGGENNFTLNGNNTIITASSFQTVPFSSGLWKYARINLPVAFVQSNPTINVKNNAKNFHMGMVYAGGASGKYGYFSGFATFDEVEVKSNSPICDSGILTLSCTLPISLQNYSVKWFDSSGIMVSQQLSVSFNNYTVSDINLYKCVVEKTGCVSDTFHLSINVTKPIKPVIQYESLLCKQDTLKLKIDTVRSGYNYHWSGPNGVSHTGSMLVIPGVTQADSGTYKLTATYSGCSVIDSVHISVEPPFNCSISGTDTFCVGGSILLHATANKAGATFSWIGPNGFTSNSSNPVINNAGDLHAGKYILFANYQSCGVVSDTIDIVLVKYSDISVSINAGLCEGDTLFMNASSPTSFHYQWLGPSGSIAYVPSVIIPDIQSVSGGLYYLNIGRTGCLDTTLQFTVTVHPLPVVTTPGVSSVCTGSTSSISLSSSVASSYSWTLGSVSSGINGAAGGNGNMISQLLTNTGNTAGTVEYMVTPLSVAGCTGSVYPITVTVHPLPVVTTPGASSVCTGSTSSISLSSSVASSYSWTLGSVSSGINGAAGGNGNMISQLLTNTGNTAGTVEYMVTPLSVAGCTGSVYPITVTVHPLPMLSILPLSPICSLNDTIYFNNGRELSGIHGVGSYLVDGFPTSYIVSSNINVGNHILTYSFVASSGCSSSISTPLVIRSLPITDAGAGKTVSLGDSLYLQGYSNVNGSFLWSPATGISSGINTLTPMIKPRNTTKYYLQVIDGFGCTNYDSVVINVMKYDLRIPNVFSPNGDGINDTWVIEYLTEFKNCKLEVFNRWGQIVFFARNYNNNWNGRTNSGKELPFATYYYVLDLGISGVAPKTGWVQIVR